MATHVIAVNFYDSTDTSAAPFSYNSFAGTSATSVNTLSSDLKNTSNVSTGYSLDVTAVFAGSGGSAATATSGTGNFTEAVCDYYWFQQTTTATLQLGSLVVGSTYTIECIGHRGGLGSRETDFTIDGTTTRYDNSGGSTPNAAVSFSGTLTGTTLDIDQDFTSTASYTNGLYITITEPSTSVTITSEPATVYSQTQASITITSIGNTPTTGNTEVKFDDDSGVAATVDSITSNGGDSYDVNFTFGRTAAQLFDDIGYPLYVEVATSYSDTSGTIPYAPKSGENYVTVGTPDTGSELYTGYAGGTFVSGDQIVYENTTTPSAIALSFASDTNFTLGSTPTSTEEADLYRIAAAGTVDVIDTITFTAGITIPTANRQTITDIADYLRTQGYVGATPDIIQKWLTDETSASGSVPDLWDIYLDAQLSTTGRTFPDKFNEWQNE
jgi:hypothetical protein